MWQNLDAPSLQAAIELVNHAQVLSWVTADFREAERSFVAKKKPVSRRRERGGRSVTPVEPEDASPPTRCRDVGHLREFVGHEVYCSESLDVDQQRIDGVAQATGDFQWIHVDPRRATLSPFGGHHRARVPDSFAAREVLRGFPARAAPVLRRRRQLRTRQGAFPSSGPRG